MRIVLVGPVPPLRGGIAQHTAALARAFGELGHDVTVESWRRQYPRLLYRRPDRDPEAGTDPEHRFDLSWADPLSWLRVARRNRDCDLLILPWVTPFHAVPLRLIRQVSRARHTVAMVHNVEPHERLPLVGPLTSVGLRGVDAAVCHASGLIADLAARGVEPADTVVFPHPPQLATEPTPLPPRPPVRLLFLGYLRHYKGPDIAIEATADLVARGLDVHLTIAGEPWNDELDLAGLAARHGIADRVRLEERYLADDELVGLLADHHLLVAPYRSATQSGVVSMALASGRPVVATDVGGLGEAVADGMTGVVCPPGDTGVFADAVERAIARIDDLAAGASAHSPTWRSLAQQAIDATTPTSAPGVVTMVADPSSAGIWRAAEELAAAVGRAGVAVEATATPPSTGRVHVHLGNSSRRALPWLARHRGAVVSIHDAVPRDRRLRRLLAPIQARILRRHHVVAHSEHAVDLLRAHGWRGDALVHPLLQHVVDIDPQRIADLRSAWRAAERTCVVVAGQIRLAKGLEEILDAARAVPDVHVVFVGRVVGDDAARALADAGDNVTHRVADDDDDFLHCLAAADALLSLRRDSVGESSGPVAHAHRLGTPVLGLALGSLPESCGPGDIVLDGECTAADLLAAVAEEAPPRLPLDAPQVPDPTAIGGALRDLYRRLGWLDGGEGE